MTGGSLVFELGDMEVEIRTINHSHRFKYDAVQHIRLIG